MSIIQEALKKASPERQSDNTKTEAEIEIDPLKVSGPSGAVVKADSAVSGGNPDKSLLISPVIKTLLDVTSKASYRKPGFIGVVLAALVLIFFVSAILLSGSSRGPKHISGWPSQKVTYKSILRHGGPSDSGTTGRIQSVAPALSRPRLTLSGIMFLVDRPRAIVNNYVVEIGDIVEGARVTGITDGSVILEQHDTEITISLK